MTQPTHYDVLGVKKNASKKEIKKAFRECSKHCHPDANPSPNAALMFRMVAEAKDILLDDGKRREYDESLESGSSEKTGSTRSEEWENKPRETPAIRINLRNFPIHLLCGTFSLATSILGMLSTLTKIGGVAVIAICCFRITMVGLRFAGRIFAYGTAITWQEMMLRVTMYTAIGYFLGPKRSLPCRIIDFASRKILSFAAKLEAKRLYA